MYNVEFSSTSDSRQPLNNSIRPLHDMRLLTVYQILRVVIGLFLLALQLTSNLHSVLGSESHTTFVWTTVSYISVCVLTTLIWPPDKLRYSQHRLVGSLLFDISAMLILLHASGGLSSGLGYLLIIYTAIASIFIQGRLGYIYAALSTVVIIGDSIYGTLSQQSTDKDLFSAGILGAVLFATTFIFQLLTEKIRTSDLAAAAQSAYAEQLQKLAQAIITRMRTGVIVVDQAGNIELINDSALQLLDLPRNTITRPTHLNEIKALKLSPDMWQETPIHKNTQNYTLESGQQVRISPAIIPLGHTDRIALYIEDNRALTQQAQHLKLASLGRLTASIAHEIRNPLGAISHASQLLQESQHIAAEDIRLVDIILQHTQRVNHIIENTLSISRRKVVQAVSINLSEWLDEFKVIYEQGSQATLQLHILKPNLCIRADPAQLSQILTNLCDNGARYNAEKTGENTVFLFADENNNNDTCFIEIIDKGHGIPPDQVDEIFNPFFTTDAKGTGLGLYICQELCEMNQAHLFYKPEPDRLPGGVTCFRIDFSHFQRMN